MDVPREVILDLLPLYLAGEASPATRALVDEHLRRDPEMAQRVRSQGMLDLASRLPSPPPPDLEMRSLRRTRALLALQKWLFGLAIGFTAIACSLEIEFGQGGLRKFRLLILDYPLQLGICLALGVGFWIAHYAIGRRLRTHVP